jgi:hypothetical protein
MSKHKPALPERLYYRLADAAQIVGCSRDDLLHYGARGYLEVITRSPYCWARGNEFDYDEGLPFFTTQPYVGFHFCALFPRVLCEIEVNGVALYDSARDLYKFVNGRLSRGMSENGFVHFPAEVANRNPESAFYWIISKERVDVAMPLDQRGFHDIEVRMDDLWVRAEELRRFQIDGSSHVQSDPPMPEATVFSGRSDKLAYLNQAAAKFWANANPSDRATHPDNDAVAAWLEGKGYSASLALKGASIVRPDWASVGRKPEE